MKTRYDDGWIEADEQRLTLRWYYFPFGSKRLAWSDIVEVREQDMGDGLWGGRWRIWGSGDFVHWFPLDPRRPRKRALFVFSVRGTPFRPCLTPGDPEAFRALLAERGVKMTAAADRPYRD